MNNKDENKSVKKQRRHEKRRQLTLFLTSFFTTLAVMGSAAGILVVDFRSRAIGWDNGGTSLAFSTQTNGVRMTLLGRSVVLPELSETAGMLRLRLGSAWGVLEPPAVRLTCDLSRRGVPIAEQAQQKLRQFSRRALGFS